MLYLFDLLLYIPVNSYGHVGTMPPFYGTSSQLWDVMTYEMCFKIYPIKQLKLIFMVGLIKLLFLERLTFSAGKADILSWKG